MTTASLDRESVSRHSVTLLCRDSGTSPLSTSVRLEIDVTDINDNPPIFQASHEESGSPVVTYVAELFENNFVGVMVSQLNATDKDAGLNGLVSYVLTDDDWRFDDQLNWRGSQQRLDVGTGMMLDQQLTGCSDKFTVDSASGFVTAKVSLDFEHQSLYRCRVLAIDGGTPRQTGNYAGFLCNISWFCLIFQ